MNREPPRAHRPPRQNSRRSRGAIAGTLLAIVFFGCTSPPPPPALPVPPPPRAPAARDPLPVVPAPPGPCETILSIEVKKSERLLLAHCHGGALRRMTVALGREPAGQKQSIGDLRTPEGLYHVVGSMKPSRFHGFIPISYPSREDAERAFASGRIGADDYQRIVAAHQRGVLPPADTPLGGEIGFHGEGERWKESSEHLDWTLGCLAVSDAQLEFLAERLAAGTPVHILP